MDKIIVMIDFISNLKVYVQKARSKKCFVKDEENLLDKVSDVLFENAVIDGLDKLSAMELLFQAVLLGQQSGAYTLDEAAHISSIIRVFEDFTKFDFAFQGTVYRVADYWVPFIPLLDFQKPINYLEIGVFYGANLFSVSKTYAKHPQSKLYAVDPWGDYQDYDEYVNEHEVIYNTFLNNLEKSGCKDKVCVKRGMSNIEVPKFDDEMFDIIYIDGNHEPHYVLEDAVIAFRKLKVGGYMIFDDYGWGGPDLTQRGIDAFLSGYYKKFKVIGKSKFQLFVQRI